jgi:cell division protein FtsX
MSLLRLTVKNASRAPVRGLLTVAAVAITLVAFGVLLGLIAAGLPALRAGRLQVTESLSHVN